MLDESRDPNPGPVTKAVERVIARRGIKVWPSRNDDLKESGLTSLDMVNLMLAVECECGIVIPTSAMTPDNFRTIATIETLVASLLAGAQDNLPKAGDIEHVAG